MKTSYIKFLYIVIITVIFLTTSTMCYTQESAYSANDSEVPQSIDELKTEIDSLLIKYQIPGVGIAIVSKDSIIYCGGLGYANVKNKIPVTENTLFRMGSITKSCTWFS